MSYIANADTVYPSDGVRNEIRRRVPTHMVAHHEPVRVERPWFIYRLRYLPIEGGSLLLRLTEDLRIQVNRETMNFEVANWGIHLPCNKAEEIPRQLGLRFLELFSKADAQILSREEGEAWVKILDRVDFRSFCIDRAAPHYMEGKLLQLEPVCRVEWHSGEITKLSRQSAATLRVLEPGYSFGVYVKLGHDNEIRSMERLTILG